MPGVLARVLLVFWWGLAGVPGNTHFVMVAGVWLGFCWGFAGVWLGSGGWLGVAWGVG